MRLKDAAAARDVLVMGPDCGTAVVGGVGARLRQRRRPGPVGIVAASGTGAQQVMALLDAAGVGVSHCLGVGGRDLSAAVGGRSTRQALAALAADPATESIVVVSKPPAAEVLADLEAYAAGLGTPVHWATLGAGPPRPHGGGRGAARRRGHAVPAWPPGLPPAAVTAPAQRTAAVPEDARLRGLFCGGTLADEAMLVAGGSSAASGRNIPLAPELALGADLRADGHVVIDFGDDRLTRGRAHPMIDPTLRLERIAAEARRPELRRAAARPRARPRRAPRPRPAAGRAVRGRARPRGRRPRPAGRRLADRHRAATRRASTRRPRRWRPPAPSVHLSNAAATRRALSLLADDARRPHDVHAAATGCSTRTRWSPRPGVDCSRTPCATRPSWSPRPTGSRRCDGTADAPRPRPGRPAPRRGERPCAATDDRGRCRPRRRASRARGAGARARAPSCTPARRSSGSAPPGRCAGALIGAMLFEGMADDRRGGRGRPRRGRGRSSSRATTATPSARWPA